MEVNTRQTRNYHGTGEECSTLPVRGFAVPLSLPNLLLLLLLLLLLNLLNLL